MTKAPVYVLITPARNEDCSLGTTIRSVARQTVLPACWLIVNDGSTDRTEEIVRLFARRYSWIRLVSRRREGRHEFGSKATCVVEAYRLLENQAFDFCGVLDADITLPPRYFSEVMENFRHCTRLGIAGGRVCEVVKGRVVNQVVARDSVPGAVQFFRRECYEQIGGYLPLPYGGIDAAAEIMARMAQWEVRSIPGLAVLHDGRVGASVGGVLRMRFFRGRTFWSLRYGLVFQIARTFRRLVERPFVVGSLFEFCGYVYHRILHIPTGLPREVCDYLRAEQRKKLLSLLGGRRI